MIKSKNQSMKGRKKKVFYWSDWIRSVSHQTKEEHHIFQETIKHLIHRTIQQNLNLVHWWFPKKINYSLNTQKINSLFNYYTANNLLSLIKTIQKSFHHRIISSLLFVWNPLWTILLLKQRIKKLHLWLS